MAIKTLAEAMKRVETWPAEAQEALAGIALEIDATIQGGQYHATEEELAGIDSGLAAVRHGQIASQERVAAVFAKHQPA
jgi:predicted transcriptional regulator